MFPQLRLIWVALMGLTATAAVTAESSLDFAKSFEPSTIGKGSTSVLRFDITNGEPFPVAGLTFTDVLPAGMTIATPSSASSDCLSATGSLSAPAGGNTISLTGGALGASSSCTVTVNVVGSIVGALQNVSGDLTSSAGNSGPASATLTIASDRPGFSKAFVPSWIPPGGTSVLTFTIDNSANAAQVNQLFFSDVLPASVVVATPSNATTDCSTGTFPPTITALPGDGSIGLTNGSVAASSTCTVEVDVTAASAGSFVNTSFELQAGVSPQLNCGFATAALEVPVQFLNKSFTDDPAVPGGTVTLEFQIQNPSRTESATAISLSDDLGAVLSGLAASGLPASNVCGAGSQLSGTDVIALAGGNLPPAGSCTFSVTLTVPPGAAVGSYLNSTTAVTALIGGSPVVGNVATDTLVVSTAPLLTKEFTDDPVVPGGEVTLRFTLLNTDSSQGATAIAFTDELPSELTTATVVPASGFCGAGSTASFTPASDFQPATITVGDANLAPGASCFFDFLLDVAGSAAGGSYPNTTSSVSASVGGEPVEGAPASDTLVIVGAPLLEKRFADDPVVAGDTVNLEFTLTNGVEAPGPATNIVFIDNLDATLSGLVAITPLPISGVCGAGSQLGGTAANLVFSGGTLAPGASCSFTVTLQVPSGASSGSFLNETSNVTATVSGLAVSGNPGSDDLDVAGLVLTKEFTDDPVRPGDSVNLQFTLDNLSPGSSATNIFFTDNLSDALTGLTITFLPPGTVCNGATLTGDTLLIFSGGSLDPGASCQFSVTLSVPFGADEGLYTNRTSQVSATFGGSAVVVEGAADELEVLPALSLTKSFLDDPAAPGTTVTLEFTLDNLALEAITNIAFTDDLSAVLPGLAASGLPDPGTACGGTVSGSNLLSYNGGSIGPLDTCSFTVTLDVPAEVGSSLFTNTTSEVTGSLSGFATTGSPASDNLEISVCLAPDGDTLTLKDDTVLDFQTYEVCDTLIVGPNYFVSGPAGVLQLKAGGVVILLNDVSVGTDGTLSIGVSGGL